MIMDISIVLNQLTYLLSAKTPPCLVPPWVGIPNSTWMQRQLPGFGKVSVFYARTRTSTVGSRSFGHWIIGNGLTTDLATKNHLILGDNESSTPQM